jgi:hypothetical protein
MPHNICCTSRRNGLGRCSRRATALFFVFTFLVFLISRGLIATSLAILALTAALTGSLLQLVTPSDVFLIIAYIGSISAFIVASYAWVTRRLPRCSNCASGARRNRALFEPRANVRHRLPSDLVFHSSFSDQYPIGCGVARLWRDPLFQLCDATSTGFGDIAPVHPLVRMLTNLEGIIGQRTRRRSSPALLPWNFEHIASNLHGLNEEAMALEPLWHRRDWSRRQPKKRMLPSEATAAPPCRLNQIALELTWEMHLRKQCQPSSRLTNYAEKACDDMIESTAQALTRNRDPHPDRKPALGVTSSLFSGSHEAARR